MCPSYGHSHDASSSLAGYAPSRVTIWLLDQRMPRTLSAILLTALFACSDPPSNPPPPVEQLPVFDVHEWGLIDTHMDGVAGELAAGPGLERDVMGGLADVLRGGAVIGKPILYFHPVAGTADFDLQVRVRLGEPWKVAEHFPGGVLSSEDKVLSWRARVHSTPCDEARHYPGRDDAACDTPDHYCEAAELAEYESGDGACVEVGEGAWPLLFYRGGGVEDDALIRLPLRITEAEDGAIRVERFADGPIIGRLWRVSSQGGRSVTAADWPRVGQPVEIPSPIDRGELEQARNMAPALLEHGLTDAEALAFARAWQAEIFGRSGAPTSGHLGGDQGAHPVQTDVLLYWLPLEFIESTAQLEFDPPARSVRRAMLVRVDLTPR